ncbi:MAG: cytochrome c maturation protein CcmE [Gemmatimonadota bacterium]|nr:cytochrome c maturation protein CcmE [Gemmatimonadota bacterium]MDH4348503.1 cytochrome c maturation protein CcmE [Gemmatimonadota bacterium]
MKAGRKFLIGSGIIVGAVAMLMTQGVKQFGQYSMKPSELAQRVSRDPSFYDTGIKMEAKVVPGSVKRNTASQTIDFVVTDGSHTYPVTYRGVAPDTFTDAQEIEVVVEGRLSRDGVFHATSLLAKCGSRYEAHYDENGKQA